MFGREEGILGKALVEELTTGKILPKRDIRLSTSYAFSVIDHPVVKELLMGRSDGSAEITLHSIKEGFAREVVLMLSSGENGVSLYIDSGNYSYKVIERPEEEFFGMLVRFFRNPLLGGSFTVESKMKPENTFSTLGWTHPEQQPFAGKRYDIASFNRLALKLESSSLNDWEDVYEAIFGMIHFINSFAQDKDDMDSLVYLMLSLMEFSNLLGVEWDKEVEGLYQSTSEPQLDLLSAVKTFSMLPFINAREVPASLNMAFSKILAATGMSLDRLYALVIENASSYVEVDDSWL